ncbi:MAG: hypothetical protein FWE83_08175 [Oscillospiraceae bacterium]|nr:hypothetical protein [Oscillospiraceae bacterium]
MELNSFIKELEKAILEYGKDHIDIFLDYDENGYAVIYGMYCSRNNSFNVTGTYLARILKCDAKRYADGLGVGLSYT